MLAPTRVRRPTALGLVVLALACARSAAPPEAPAEAATESEITPDAPETATPVSSAEEPLASPEAEPASASTTSSSTTPPSVGPAEGARAPRDSRGKDEIQQVMVANRDKVRACYDAALAQNPGIQGDLVVSFVIDPHGDVKQVEVNWSESDLHIPELDTCAVDAVRSFKFPASSRGLESKVNYPFNFKPPRSEPPPKKP